MTSHPFDQAIALNATGEHTFTGATSPAYANMVGPYGGITAATALNAVLQHPALLGEPVSLTVNFCAAVADGPFEVQAVAARTNRSTQHWTVAITQGGETMVTATALTAVRRDTWAAVEHTMPDVPAPGSVPLPTARGRVEWLNRYEMRFIEGGFPGVWDERDQGHSRTRQWVRDQPPRPLDFASLAAMADVFSPRIWHRRARFVPLGTVSITVYFHASQALLSANGDAHVLGQAQGQAFGQGFFDHSAQIWNQSGVMLATSHQVVYFKE
ncbi:acyl-CoA thioesterase [Hydrogenophaga crassostreae]|uniref:Acyl-CoA thioesterase n=1 Tax=Hydrogenophaga crassostreae TaxID=1763535 RepID=A0A162VZ56_9BURK|nr:thioesterase family protein [Hydrogenophaga crassostreae]AOW14981.1 acyl-CoA thioesterase [Hydrogenophaga crassostreae]OAD41395.1 acyl-CoA thioesterase [Hydrogenophaga crassostreae]